MIVDLKFAPRHLTNLVNDNPVETEIVQVTDSSYLSLLISIDLNSELSQCSSNEYGRFIT